MTIKNMARLLRSALDIAGAMAFLWFGLTRAGKALIQSAMPDMTAEVQDVHLAAAHLASMHWRSGRHGWPSRHISTSLNAKTHWDDPFRFGAP